MKISKSRIQQIIKEELQKITEEEDEDKLGSFGTVRKSAQTVKKDFKRRGDDAVSQADEYTNLERGIVQQINDVLEKLALESDIDQGEIKSQLTIIYKRLVKILQNVRANRKEEQK